MLRTAFQPDHFNYSFLQNKDRHVHLHVIPRYAAPRRFLDRDFTDANWLPPEQAPPYAPAARILSNSEMELLATHLLRR